MLKQEWDSMYKSMAYTKTQLISSQRIWKGVADAPDEVLSYRTFSERERERERATLTTQFMSR